ncbi:hypothetical protein Aph01nite_00180 [Acrocarpospora phusangensis]|uniref:Uncharacterized protein n=1 Tax=Acrocarpospora phusangensis TaxID=1070424 RepID=A0A919UKV6_9ACTN|nr:hypothetical protein [Acrocarpospora phusangensis]GIH21708.1 hypothetical protein Aph01nite_00180 [Acrocarpospora phusangensis]
MTTRSRIHPARAALAAAAAAAPLVALALATSTSTANAATTHPTTPNPTVTWATYEYHWGPYHAKNEKAKAEGDVIADVAPEIKSNRVRVKGELWNLDHGKCAVLEIKIHRARDRWDWHDVKWCGPNYKSFNVSKRNVDLVKVRVSQSDKWGRHLFNKGQWQTIYDLNGKVPSKM